MPNGQHSTKCDAENSVAANFKNRPNSMQHKLMQSTLFFTIPRAVNKSSESPPPGPFWGILALLTDSLDSPVLQQFFKVCDLFAN